MVSTYTLNASQRKEQSNLENLAECKCHSPLNADVGKISTIFSSSSVSVSSMWQQ